MKNDKIVFSEVGGTVLNTQNKIAPDTLGALKISFIRVGIIGRPIAKNC